MGSPRERSVCPEMGSRKAHRESRIPATSAGGVVDTVTGEFPVPVREGGESSRNRLGNHGWQT
jgi:hypothetical protein